MYQCLLCLLRCRLLHNSAYWVEFLRLHFNWSFISLAFFTESPLVDDNNPDSNKTSVGQCHIELRNRHHYLNASSLFEWRLIQSLSTALSFHIMFGRRLGVTPSASFSIPYIFAHSFLSFLKTSLFYLHLTAQRFCPSDSTLLFFNYYYCY